MAGSKVQRATAASFVLAAAGLVGALAGLPTLNSLLKILLRGYPAFDAGQVAKVAVPVYISLAATIVGMVLALLLLNDIRRDRVFTAVNVLRLRLLTYSGFIMVVPYVVGAGLFVTIRIPFIVMAAVTAAFLGVLMYLIRSVMRDTQP